MILCGRKAAVLSSISVYLSSASSTSILIMVLDHPGNVMLSHILLQVELKSTLAILPHLPLKKYSKSHSAINITKILGFSVVVAMF